MADKNNPVWGSEEFNKAIEEHDDKADPKREEKGLKYTKKAETKAASTDKSTKKKK